MKRLLVWPPFRMHGMMHHGKCPGPVHLHSIVDLEDGVLGGQVQGPSLLQSILKAGLRKPMHALLGVEPRGRGKGWDAETGQRILKALQQS